MIYENAEQTSLKVYEVLKQAFPDVEFHVTTRETLPIDYVVIRWTDGPMLWQVKDAVGFMESASNDPNRELGYTYKGERYRGADYIVGERLLSEARKAKIHKRLESIVQKVVNSADSWEGAEMELIQQGELPATYRTVEDSEPPVIDRRQGLPLNVVAFPDESILTPEQELKFFLMNLVAAEMPYIGGRLRRNGKVIDELFQKVANTMYSAQKGIRQ